MKLNLFYKIFFAFLAIALIPVLVGGKLFTSTLEDHLQQSIYKESQITLHKNATLISSTVENLDRILKTTAKYLIIAPEDKETLHWIYRLHPEIDKIVEVDIHGIILNAISRYEFLPSGSKLNDCNPARLDHAIIRFENWANEPHICFKNPIKSLGSGKHVGALFAKANVHNLFQEIIRDQKNDHIQFLVNANNNTVVFHPDFNLVLGQQSAIDLPIVKKLHTAKKLVHSIYTDFSGDKVIGTAIPVPGTPLYLIDEISYQKAFSLLTTYRQLINKVVWISIGFILLSAFLASRSITNPVSKLLAATKNIEDGDLDTPLPETTCLFPDEITGFSRRFKTMIEALKHDRVRRDEAIKVEQEMQEKLHQAQKMETIGLLTGGAAHDLNNILSGIIGYPELILRKLPEDSPLRPSIEAIRQSGENAGAIVADLLTVSRGVAAPHQLCNINQIIGEYLESPEWKTLRRQHAGLSLNLDLFDDLQNINGSLIHIKKTLMNLVTNAIEALEGKGSLLIKTENYAVKPPLTEELDVSAGSYVILQVTDNGSGIPEEDLKRIFEPFFTKKVMGRSGTGLGLTIVANTVQDHDGGMKVESSSEGTTFKLFFPATTSEKLTTEEKAAPAEIRGNNEHILVIDDIPQQRDLAKQILTELGYHVDTVASGEEAILFLKKNTVELLVLDMIMDPGINGYETYKLIIADNPQQKAVIASGFAGSADVKKTLKLGAGAFIQKPYSMSTIAGAVNKVLNS